MKNFDKLSNEIIEYVGGASNIKALSFCMTRLRVNVKDENLVDKEKIKGIDEVMQLMVIGGQFQIVLGGIVDEVHKIVSEKVGISSGDKIMENEDSLGRANLSFGSSLRGMVETLSEIVAPIIPAMLSAGFIKTLAVLAEVLFKVPVDNSTLQLLHVIADTLYQFFPVIIAWSAARKFGANIGISIVMVGLLVNPSFTGLFQEGVNLNFLGIPVTNVYYGSSVLPAILSVYILSKLEIALRKVIPGSMRSIFVPFLSALIVTPLLITVIGPIGVWGGNIFASLFTATYAFSPILAGAIIGGVWQILIIFGMHIAILGLVSVPNIAATGRDMVIMTHAPSLICQISAGLAVSLKAKDKNLKKQALTLSLTSFFAGSVVEPVMYGINLKYKKPFIAVCIGGAVGGAIAGGFGAGTTAAVAFSLYTIPAYLGAGFGGLMLGTLVGALLTFVLTWVMGFDETIV